MGREQPVVTLREFFALATCYAGSAGWIRPKTDVRLRQLLNRETCNHIGILQQSY